jgi:uncharacterized membrane protein YdjX (TVP38/TMEM64 family)
MIEDQAPTAPPAVRRRWWRTRAAYRFFALTALVATLGVIVLTLHPDRATIANALGTKSPLAPVIAVGGTALLTAALVPRTLLSAVGGLLFGWFPGAWYILLGVTIGAIGAFLIGHLLGREFMARHLKGRLLHIEQAVANRGVLAVALSRMVPIVPFAISNYVFGTTSVRFLPFVTGTVLGALPATLAYAALGSAAAHHNTTGMSMAGTVVAALAIAGCVGTVLIWRRRPRHTA